MSLVELQNDARRRIEILKNERKNEALEKSMGLNDQPVGPEEIDELAKLLESDGVRAKNI